MKSSTEIFYLADGFIISTENNKYQVRWDDIIKIAAHKLDLLTADVVRIDLFLKENYKITLNEDEPYWDDFKGRMEKKLNISDDWWGEVLLPPFQRNEKIIFSKAS